MQGTAPWYSDWQFWAFAVAAVAILLSQLPPIRSWFTAGRLEVVVQNRVHVNHKVGNTNVNLFVSLSCFGKAVRIKGASIKLSRDGKHVGTYNLRGFFETQTSASASIFMPFLLRPEEVWTHTMTFYPDWPRAVEKAYRQSESVLRANVQEKLAARNGMPGFVEGDPELVQPLIDMLRRDFQWHEGEYTLTFDIETDSPSSAYSSEFKFTLFEADSEVLRSFEKRYPRGDGLWYWDHNVGINIPLHVA